MKNSLLHSLLFSLILFSCRDTLPTLDGFGTAEWKQDTGGCDGKRSSMKNALQQQKNKLLGLDEMDIITLLGSPDENELYTRNQKFYHYYLDPSANCSSPDMPGDPGKLTLRFNAMGLVKEVTVN